MNHYSIMLPKHVLAGPNSIDAIGDMVKSLAIQKVLLITSNGVWDAGLVEKPLRLLKENAIVAEVIRDLPCEPEIGRIEEILRAYDKSRYDMVVGIGGGNAMDTAKIVAALMTGEQQVQEVVGIDKIAQKGLPTLLVPTTTGTGTEAIPGVTVTVPEQGQKVEILSGYLMADRVILDPVLTVKLPPALTAAAGLDALAHAMECYILKKSNIFSDTLALAALRLIYGSIRKAYLIGNDVQARHNMLIGSFYGGMCIASTGTAAVHALAHPLGGKYKIPHGISNAILLPQILEFNKDLIADKLCVAAVEMDIDVVASTKNEIVELVIEKLNYLIDDLGMCISLKDYGINANDLPILVEEAAKMKRLLENNPRQIGADDLYAIYQKIFTATWRPEY
jgi:alcohol dehydrogenase